jgi:hypothetical protein
MSDKDRFSVRFALIDVDRIMGRLIRNPGYGGESVSLNNWKWLPRISNHTKAGFQAALDASVAESGIKNPILVWALPEGILLTFGGSRVKACRNVGVARIPAIINDYTEEFKDAPEVTRDNWRTFFEHPPRDVEFGEYGFDYHYNLERARRFDHDPAGFAWLEGETPEFIATEFPWVLEED